VVWARARRLVVELIAAYRERYSRPRKLSDSLASLEGVYVPERYEMIHDTDARSPMSARATGLRAS